MWPKLDSVKNSQDGVTTTSIYTYNSTLRDPYQPGNGLVKTETEVGNKFNKVNVYKYAYEEYS